MSRLKTMSVHSAAKFVGGWTAWCETSLKGWTETEENHAHTNRWVKNQTHAPSTLRRRKRSFISAVRPTVHTNEAFPRRSSNREEFENVALFLRLGLPSTLIRHRNETFRLFKLEEFENEALFLRLGPQSTLIRHKSEAIPRRSLNRRNLKTPNFAFIRGRITFWKRGYSKTMRASQQSREFPSDTNPKWPATVAFLNISVVVLTESIWGVFRVKPSFSNSSGTVSVGGALTATLEIFYVLESTRKFVMPSALSS